MKRILSNFFPKNSRNKIIIGCLIFIVGFLWMYDEGGFVKPIQSDFSSYVGGKYLRLVYIGSASCAYSNNKKTHRMIISLKNSLRKIAHKKGLKFASTGIAVGMNSLKGVKYLLKTAPYDELITGASWFNLGINHYIWQTNKGEASTPQVILTMTKYKMLTIGERLGYIKRQEDILKRYIGRNGIKKLYTLIKSKNERKINTILHING